MSNDNKVTLLEKKIKDFEASLSEQQKIELTYILSEQKSEHEIKTARLNFIKIGFFRVNFVLCS
jgi:hypothetical protein